jgi:uncharacterized membrane protein YgcG
MLASSYKPGVSWKLMDRMSERILRSTAIEFKLMRLAEEFAVLFEGTKRAVRLEDDRTESIRASGLKVNERIEGGSRRETGVRRRRRGRGEGGGASGLGERSGGGKGGGESLSGGELRGRSGSIASRFSKAVLRLRLCRHGV